MIIIKDKYTLKNLIKNSIVSFVPTMGGLHKGHEYLIRQAKQKSKNILVSIYVNPKQFNSKSDFNKYPRNLKKDLKILKRNKVKYVFLPTYNQIFNFRTIKPIYLSKFAKQLCGKYRPGHFKGVINVVNRFLEIISPKYIFLGEKDYQQLILIKEHIKKNNIKTKVIPCKTIREVNGLACSSRNKSLSKSQFNLAGIVFKTIKKMMGKNSLKEIKFQLNKLGIKKIDYIEKIKIKNETRLFIAYYIRQTRLIDNIKLN